MYVACMSLLDFLHDSFSCTNCGSVSSRSDMKRTWKIFEVGATASYQERRIAQPNVAAGDSLCEGQENGI